MVKHHILNSGKKLKKELKKNLIYDV